MPTPPLAAPPTVAPPSSPQVTAASGADPIGEPARLGWRILLTIILLILLSIAGSYRQASAAPLPQSSGDPLVLAFYYTWYDENTWSYDQLADLPAESYVSRDRGVMGRHIDQAKAAGIDAFIVAWYGPDGNQTEENLRALLDEAAARNFKIGVLFESNSPFMNGVDGAAGALSHWQASHAQHPAYLRVDGRPVLFFWRTQQYGAGTWEGLRNAVDPGRGTLWIADGTDTGYLGVFDGHHLYSNTWNPPADLAAINNKFATQVAAAGNRTGVYKFWVATVMPGYDDIRVRGGFAQDRAGGAYYERSWQAALGSNPDWIMITSFNEWPEGSQIEPSVSYGNRYLELTAAYAGQFRAGGGTAPALPSAAPAEPLPTVAAEAVAEGMVATVTAALVNLRAGPGTGYGVVGQAGAGALLPVSGRSAASDWWQVRAENGEAWVFAELVSAGPVRAETTGQGGELGTGDLSGAEVTAAEPVAGVASLPTAMVIVGLANLRLGPATTFDLAGTAAEGTSFPITGRSLLGTWWQVDVDGQRLWVLAELVTAAGSLRQVPLVSAAE
jgi:uncharacterized protein YraI